VEGVSPPAIWLIAWLDAWHDCRPHVDIEDLRPVPPRKSVGFLVKQDGQYCYLAVTLDADGEVGQVMQIPLGCIQRMSKMREV